MFFQSLSWNDLSQSLFWNDLSQSPFGPLKSIKGRAKIHRNSNLEAKSGYDSMLEADKLEVGAQDEDFVAMLGQLGSNSIEGPQGGTPPPPNLGQAF